MELINKDEVLALLAKNWNECNSANDAMKKSIEEIRAMKPKPARKPKKQE